MASPQRFHYAGVSAYLSGVAVLVSFVSLLLFYTTGAPWGVLFDAAILFQLLFMLPFIFILQVRSGSESSGRKLLSARLWIFLIVFMTIAQALVVFNVFGPRDFVRTLDMNTTISTSIALWLGVFTSSTRDKNLERFATLAVVGYLVTIVVFRYGGQVIPLIFLGVLASTIGYSVWSIMLGRLLLADKSIG